MKKVQFLTLMTDLSTLKRVTRDISTTTLNFDGPFFDLHITQEEVVFVGSVSTMEAKMRNKLCNDPMKQVEGAKSTKRAIVVDVSKVSAHNTNVETRKKISNVASGSKGKYVAKGDNSKTLKEKVMYIFLSHCIYLYSHANT